MKILKRLKDIGAPYREILQNTGSLLAEKGLFEKALEFYRAALSCDPTYARCRRNYARALLQRGKELGRAVEVAERSLKELPPDPALLRLLGAAYRKLGRCGAAREVYLLVSSMPPRR